MTEQEWLESSEPEKMLPLVDLRWRKLKLFACACCRQVCNQFVPRSVVRAVTAAEMAVDGEISVLTLQEKVTSPLRRAAAEAMDRARADGHSYYLAHVTNAAYYAGFGQPMTGAVMASRSCAAAAADLPVPPVGRFRHTDPEYWAELALQADMLRDIFGNPFRSVEFQLEWFTSDVLLLARGIYDERAFDRMPILADALQDAGCDDDDILNHCREAREHARGCWVVDLLLGKK